MFFLMRAAFWLTIVIFLLPADPETGEAPRVGAIEALSAVHATATDFSGFCARNPDVCATGSATFELLSEKVRNGVRIIQNAIDGGASAADTLTTEDVAAPWRGPRTPGAV
jgi:hypothetical protein